MADRPPPDRLNCPVCNKLCTVPGANAESFPNNLYALHIIEMDKDSVGHENTILKLNKTIHDLNYKVTELKDTLEKGQNDFYYF